MKLKQKILAFVTDGGKFLAVHSEYHPEHGDEKWFTVTGGLEENETHEEAVKRELKEETGLESNKIVDLNWGSEYEWNGEKCEEKNFIAFVNSGDIVLNEEHDKYEWLELDEFVNRINWDEDKILLKKVLEKALKKEVYFDKKERELD